VDVYTQETCHVQKILTWFVISSILVLIIILHIWPSMIWVVFWCNSELRRRGLSLSAILQTFSWYDFINGINSYFTLYHYIFFSIAAFSVSGISKKYYFLPARSYQNIGNWHISQKLFNLAVAVLIEISKLVCHMKIWWYLMFSLLKLCQI